MNDFKAYRRSAIRYWEWRRIIYNLALVLPAFVGFAVTDVLNHAGDAVSTNYDVIFTYLALSAIGANICYSLAYALEFLFGSDNPGSLWLLRYRTIAFVCGVLFAMLLALIGGSQIANIAWNERIRESYRLEMQENR